MIAAILMVPGSGDKINKHSSFSSLCKITEQGVGLFHQYMKACFWILMFYNSNEEVLSDPRPVHVDRDRNPAGLCPLC